MALSKTFRFGIVTAILLASVAVSRAQDPCESLDRRALVFSGGGIKGAFEAGAAYHLIVHRGCDFHDFSGISVGAINAAILAQALSSNHRETSHAALVVQAESLVNIWASLKSSRDIVKPRKLAGLRFAMFGTENFNDFSPLRRLLAANISINKLAAGRPLRIGLTCFWDGTYQEVAAARGDFSVPKSRFLDYLYASSVLPVMGRMPRFASRDQKPDTHRVAQFGDASLRHVIPVASYFVVCSGSECSRAKPAHEPLQQLFVIATSPYVRGSDLLPVPHSNYGRADTELITDGRKIMRRAIALMADTPFRTDLDSMLLANQWLAWREHSDSESALRARTESSSSATFAIATAFPLESYNREGLDSYAHSRPYRIGIVKPKEETADLADLLSFSPQMIHAQLLAGCLAANETMQSEFGLASLSTACADRFGNSRIQIAAIVRPR